MPSPKDYLKNPREADLAERVWQKTIGLKLQGYSMQDSVHEYFAKVPWINQRIILARDWITYYRERDSLGGVQAVNQQLGGTDFTAGEIGNVEHFYVAAFMGAILPNNPIWFGMMSSASMVWELVVGPARIAWLKRDLPKDQLLKILRRNFNHNLDQYSHADVAGLKFGEFYSLSEAAELLEEAFADDGATETPQAGAARRVTVKPGDSLSLIAQREYQDMLLWPVIYDANTAVIGTNPNRILPGQVLAIPGIEGMAPSRRDRYRHRGKNWRQFN